LGVRQAVAKAISCAGGASALKIADKRQNLELLGPHLKLFHGQVRALWLMGVFPA